jgi:DNA processing protein
MSIRQVEQTEARIGWSLIAEPGDPAVNRLIDQCDGDASEALSRAMSGDFHPTKNADVTPDMASKWMMAGRNITDDVQRIVDRLGNDDGIGTLIPGDAGWPTAKLDKLENTQPYILFTKGNAGFVGIQPTTALIGARAATGYGEHVTMEMAAGLADRMVTTISGAAYGIDGMAHRATLAEHGRTIAVLAGGLDRFYPSGHEALLHRIAESGLILSEIAPGNSPTKNRFLQRNRLIATLSDAVIVVEAGFRSGALSTANHAKAMEIPVGAVPGPVTSAASSGCHRLIREGANLITNVDEAYELTIEGRNA